MADTRVGIDLVATNRASPMIDQVSKSLGGMNRAAGLAMSGLGGLAGAAGMGAIMDMAQRAGAAVMQLSGLAAQSSMVSSSMQGLAASFGQSADDMVEAMKRASMGTIPEYDLMLAANKAMMLGVAQDASELEGIIKVAMSRGAAMGLSTTQAFDDLVTGLGRGSALILDNLGITMDSLRQAEESYAQSLGKTTRQLTDQEKKQGMVNAVLKEAASIDMGNVDEMAKGFAQAQASIADMKVALGELFGPAVAAVASSIAEAVEGAKDLLDAMTAPVPPDSLLNIDEQVTRTQEKIQGLAQATATFEQTMGRIDKGLVNEAFALNDTALLDMLRNPSTSLGSVPQGEGLYLSLLEALREYEELMRKASSYQLSLGWNAGEETRLATAVDEYNRLNEAMAQAQALSAASSQAHAQSMQSIADMTRRMTENLLPDMGPQVFGMEAGWAAQFQAQFDALTANGYEAADAMLIVANNIRETTIALSDAASATESYGSKMGSLAAQAANLGVHGKTVANAARLAGEDFLTAADKAERLSWALGSVASAAQKAQNALVFDRAASSLQSAAMGAIDTLGAVTAYNLYEDQLASLADVQADYVAQGYRGVELEFLIQQEINERTAATQNLVEGINAAKDAMNSGTQAATNYGSALGNIKAPDIGSKVSGALQSALNLNVGVNPADYMPRPDAANENARRLASIMVEGMNGQSWMGEFANEVPDIYAQLLESQDPSAAAAKLLTDFQKGLVPQLIDKETIMQQVKDALMGEANMAALAQEITQDLVNQGMGDPTQIQALVNQSMGLKAGQTGTGDLTTNVIGQLKSEDFLNGVKGAGGTAATNWGSAFLASVGENVPMALILILAQLVAPILAGNQADDASRTGAQ